MPTVPPTGEDRRRVRAALGRLMPRWDRTRIMRIDYLPGGYTHRNYRIEVGGCAYALRVVEQTGAPDGGTLRGVASSPRRESRIHERRYLDIPAAPDVIAHDEDTGYLLTGWIDGSVLAEAPPTPLEAGIYLAALHSQIPTGIRRYDYSGEVAAMFRRARRVDPLVAGCFERLAWSPAQSRGCHNDLNPWNIVRTELPDALGPFRTLDWETAGDNDPLFDLAGLCLGLEWGLAQAAECLEACRASGTAIAGTRSRLADTMRAFVIREYAWAIAQLAIGNDHEGIRDQARRTRQTLADWR